MPFHNGLLIVLFRYVMPVWIQYHRLPECHQISTSTVSFCLVRKLCDILYTWRAMWYHTKLSIQLSPLNVGTSYHISIALRKVFIDQIPSHHTHTHTSLLYEWRFLEVDWTEYAHTNAIWTVFLGRWKGSWELCVSKQHKRFHKFHFINI